MTLINNTLLYLQKAQKALNDELKDVNSRIESLEVSIDNLGNQVLKETDNIIERETKIQKIKEKIVEHKNMIKKIKEENGLPKEVEQFDNRIKCLNNAINNLYIELNFFKKDDKCDNDEIDKNADSRTLLLNEKLNLTNYKNKCINLLDDIEIKIDTNEFEENEKEDLKKQLKDLTTEYIENKLKDLNALSIKHTKIELFLMTYQ